MKLFNWAAILGRDGGEDSLMTYRHPAMRALAILGVIFLTPFLINNFLQGRIAVGIAVLVSTALLSVNAAAIGRGRRPPIPFSFFLIPTISTLCLSLRDQGFVAVLWAYPTVLLFYFATSRRAATLYSVTLLLFVGYFAYRYVDAPAAIRFAATFSLTVIAMNIALSIVDDLHRKLAEQSISDPLTGAFNRRHMASSLDQVIERNNRNGAPATVLLIDIDHFKRINDQYGHAIGDDVLKAVVSTIANRIRKLDLLFRTGGEEFLVLLPDTTEEQAATIAEELRTYIARAPLVHDIAVTVSIGISEFRSGQPEDAWLKMADKAMYRAKKTGRNRVARARDEEPQLVAT